MTATDTAPPPSLTPHLSLTLRLRFLENLLRPTPSPHSTSSIHPPIARRINHVNDQLTAALAGGSASSGGSGGGTAAGGATDALRRFVHNYDLNAPLLSVAPVPFSSSTDSDAHTPQAKVALILEAENEIRQLERELRELQILDERGVVGAGKLGDHEALKDDLAQLRQATTPVSSSYAALETRTLALLTSYNDYISTLSELFVSWNDVLSEAEDSLTRIEKERAKGFDVE